MERSGFCSCFHRLSWLLVQKQQLNMSKVKYRVCKEGLVIILNTIKYDKQPARESVSCCQPAADLLCANYRYESVDSNGC